MADFMENLLCVVGNIHAQHRNTLPTTEHFLTQIKTNRSGLEITSEKRQCLENLEKHRFTGKCLKYILPNRAAEFQMFFFLSRRDISSSSCSKSSSFIWEVRLKWSCSFFFCTWIHSILRLCGAVWIISVWSRPEIYFCVTRSRQCFEKGTGEQDKTRFSQTRFSQYSSVCCL